MKNECGSASNHPWDFLPICRRVLFEKRFFKAENKTRFRITESVTIQDIKADKRKYLACGTSKPVETPKIKTIEFVVPKVVPDKEVVTSAY